LRRFLGCAFFWGNLFRTDRRVDLGILEESVAHDFCDVNCCANSATPGLRVTSVVPLVLKPVITAIT